MYKKNKGFTLIELLVVIAILGLLATIVAVSLTSARARARDSRRVSDLRQLELALELYYAANEQYPEMVAGASSTAPFDELIADGYLNMKTAPNDPTTGNTYCYATLNVTGATYPTQYYHMGAILENKESDMLNDDLDFDSSGGSWVSNGTCTGDTGSGFDGGETILDDVNGIYDRAIKP